MKPKKVLLLSLCLILFVTSCKETSQDKLQTLSSQLAENLYNNIIPFWVNHDVDLENGGFYGVVDYKGDPDIDADKAVILNARILWTFSSIYIKDQDETSKKMADRAYEYMKTYFLDEEYGGVYYSLDYKGVPTFTQKNVYANAFAIYGFSEYARATGNKEALEIAVNLFKTLDKYAHDDANKGYNESYNRDWTPMLRRRPSETVAIIEPIIAQNKTMNTSLHVMEALANLYRVWQSPQLESRLEEMIIIFLDKIINPETNNQNYELTPEWDNNSNIKSYGHDIECSWLLLESAEILGNESLIERCKKASIDIANAVIPAILEDGRMIYDVEGDETPSPFIQWWAQAEAVVGCVNAWQLTGDDVWMDRATLIWDFTDKTFVDKQYGEWYSDIDKNDVLRTKADKVDGWKCPYHNSRMCMEVIRRANLYK